MKISAYLISILMMLGMLIPAWGQPYEEVEAAEPCSPEEIKLEVQTENAVTFVSGGIGICESQEMQRIAHTYQLALVFVQRTGNRENYLASIPIIITDSQGRRVLETVSKGPYLLANMPKGRYTVEASFNGEHKRQSLTVQSKHQRRVFVWQTNDEG